MNDSFRDWFSDEDWGPCLPPLEFSPDESPSPRCGPGEENLVSWRARWSPRCPDGNRQVVRRAEGFRERNPRELELRVLLCAPEDRFLATRHDRHYVDCPVRVWLAEGLGDRAVIDVDTGEESAGYRPHIVGLTRRPDGGYHPANRRRC